MSNQPQMTPARELFRLATEQGWAAFEAACRKTLADEWRMGFDAGARVASRLIEEAERGNDQPKTAEISSPWRTIK